MQAVTENKISVVSEGSIKAYAEELIAKGTSRAVPVVKALLNYGANAQLFFDYNTDNLANVIDGVSIGEDMSGITQENFAQFNYTNDTTIVTGANYNLSVESKVTLKMRLAVKSQNLTITLDGEEVAYEKSGTQYVMVNIEDIVAKDLSKELNLVISDGTTTETFKVSAFTYGYNVLGNATSDETLKDTLRAMYLYNQAAIAYFNGN